MSLAKQLQQLRRTQQGDSTRSSCRTRSGRSSLRPHTLVLYSGSLLQAYLRLAGWSGGAAGRRHLAHEEASPPRLSDSVLINCWEWGRGPRANHLTVSRAAGRERGVQGWEGGGLQAGNRSRSARTPHRVGVDVARQVDEPVDDCLRHLGGVKRVG